MIPLIISLVLILIGAIIVGKTITRDAPKNDGCICKSYQPDDDMRCMWESDCKEKTK